MSRRPALPAFCKPYIASLFPGTAAPRHYPYPDEMLRHHDIFPLFVLDGGAFFFLMDHLGDATGRAILTALKDGRLLAPWMTGDRLEWDRFYDLYGTEPGKQGFEQHVWLNRLYFLLPIAQAFARTGAEQWSRLWFRYLSDWLSRHPWTSVAVRQARVSRYCWSDMQVTWRLLVLIHSVALLGGSRGLDRRRWHAVYRAVHLHARHVRAEAAAALDANAGRGNHFLQKGTALLYAGLLFPEFPDAGEFVEIGRRVVRHQLGSEILRDGGSVEASPSYSHFIARLYLDAYRLLALNGAAPIAGLAGVIRRQYGHLEAIASPQGLTLPLSDSYAMDAAADLSIVRQLVPLPPPRRPRSRCFRESRLAVLRNERLAVCVDAASAVLWHHHPGKPNVVIDVDGQPLVIDSGCCNYDLDARRQWFMQPGAHNVVVIEGGTADEPGTTGPDIRLGHSTHDRVCVDTVGQVHGVPYRWRRTVRLQSDRVIVCDTVTAKRPMESRQVFHLDAVGIRVPDGRRPGEILLKGGLKIRMRMRPVPGACCDLTYRPCMGPTNRPGFAAEWSCRARGKALRFQVEFQLSESIRKPV